MAAPTTPPPPTMPPVGRPAGVPMNVAAPKLAVPEGKMMPPRIVLMAVEGYGKSTIGATAIKPMMLMARGESGYLTLLGQKLVPAVPAAAIESWGELLALLDQLTTECPGKTLVLDALGGFERLCHEHVCLRDFKGDWGEKGFSSYQKGYDVAVTDWIDMLARLDAIRTKGVMVIALSHCQIKTHKNPLGEDFDRYVANVHGKTWGVTAQWADAVLFGNFLSITDKLGKGDMKKKGIGGTERILYCERRDAFDAKNRYGMPAELAIPNDPAQAWPTIWNALTGKEM